MSHSIDKNFMSNILTSTILKCVWNKTSLSIIFMLSSMVILNGQDIRIDNLRVDLLLYPHLQVSNGYPVAGSPDSKDIKTLIFNKQPLLSWELLGDADCVQSAYQVILSDNREDIEKGLGNMWNSGQVASNESINILYTGKDLNPSTTYFWRVKVWNEKELPSSWSPICEFHTAQTLEEYKTAYYPLQKTDELPAVMRKIEDIFRLDFGKAAFGQLSLTLESDKERAVIFVRLGEATNPDGSINRKPGGTIRYAEYPVILRRGKHTYHLKFTPDKRNTGPMAIHMPEYIGDVLPFRYVEIEGYQGSLEESNITRSTVYYPFDDFASYFHSSDSILNAIWELCKYSIKVVSFAGIYVDGDRERIPYEADAIVNQLSNYYIDKEYSIARRTLEHLIFNGTWFTDNILHTVPIAFNDYLYTGDIRMVQHQYENLKAKLLLPLREANGLMSTRTGKQSPELMKEIHALRGSMADLVDWPHGGETDGFVFTTYNAVVNALHYKALCDMAKIAKLLGKNDDVILLDKYIKETYKAFQSLLWDKNKRLFKDGVETDHISLHTNMMALAFGLVPEKHIDDVMTFIRSRGMACGPYTSLFLLDAVYKAGDADYGLSLLTSKEERSWYNMIRTGSTVTMEAWDKKYKSNLDWNHGWGTVPASVIPGKLMGIEPLEPGFSKIRVRPQPGSLEKAEIKVPTIRGDIFMSFQNKVGQSFSMELTIPGNTKADIYLPFWSKSQKITVNGKPVQYRKDGNFAVIENISSGNFSIQVLVKR